MRHTQFVDMLRSQVKTSSCTAVAKELGVSQSYLSEVLSGKRGVGEKLLSATGYRMDYVRLRK